MKHPAVSFSDGAPPAASARRGAPHFAMRGVVLAACVLAAPQVFAQSAGNVQVNVGWFHLAPIDSSDPLKVNTPLGSSTVANSGASVKNSDTVAFTIAYFLTNHIALEGVFGVPPKMRIEGSGSLAQLGELGTAREWSPTILLKYYFGQPQAKLRPYLGAGASYVWYSNVKLSQGLSSGAFLGSPLLAGATHADLSSSLVPVFNGGLSYQFNRHWSVNASVSYLLLSTRATLTTQSAIGTIRSETKLRVNPIVSLLSVGYTF